MQENIQDITTQDSFWALFELMGHNRIIGKASVWEFGQAKFFRVDVLDCEGKVFYTRALAPASIYSITTLTEDSAKTMAMQLQDSTEMLPLDLQNFMETMRQKLIREIYNDPDSRPDDDDDDDNYDIPEDETDSEIDLATDDENY